jgi:predicted nucleotidyltransferase
MRKGQYSSGKPSLEEIQAILRKHLPELRKQYGVKSLGIFGSYTRGAAKKRSDLDILVEFERIGTLLEYIRLEEILTDLLGVKVDLVDRSTLKHGIKARILREAIPV